MGGVWSALGYDEVVLAAAKALQDDTAIGVVEGPPGIGKSWLAMGIGAMWDRAGGSTVVAQGDDLHSDIAHYPLHFAMAGLGGGWRSLRSPITELARAGESHVGTAGVITATVQAIGQLRPRRRKAWKMFLGDAEQQILFDLANLAGRKPLLLIADNLHWWDPASLEFLGRMREPRMREAFPFLESMRLLVVQTVEPYQHVAHPRAHDALLAPGTTRRLSLDRVRREGFAEVLEALGAPAGEAAANADAIFALTGGHLLLAHRCAARLAQGGGSELFTGAIEAADFVSTLLTERIRALGEAGSEAVSLLQIAATLGLRFRRDEVDCAWGERSETSRLLRYLRDNDLVELSDDAGWFVHDLYRQHFLTADGFDRVAVHERLSDCLRQLSPSDYEARCQNAVYAERHGEAATFAVQACLARVRDGASPWDVSTVTRTAVERGGMAPLVDRFVDALRHLDDDRYDECLGVMSGMSRSLPEALLAEADLIRARCLMSTRSDEDRAQGRALVAAWAGYETTETDLGVRLMLLHLFGLAMLPDKTAGRTLEGRIKEVLRSRSNFDPAAADAMAVLDRCGGSLWEPEMSLYKVRDAVTHFGPVPDQLLVRRPMEYYRSLVNLGADLIVSARYAESRTVAADLDRFVSDYTPGTFPRLDFAASNALLADHRLGVVDASGAVRRQQAIIDEHGVPGDPFYPGNALAVYLALAGRTDDALAHYEELLAHLRRRRDPEPSMLYLLSANCCSTRYVSGEGSDVLSDWVELTPVVERIPYPIATFLVRRHQLLREVMAEGTPLTAVQLDECLVRGRPPELGPMWDQLGRGFRMPEVMWWT